MKGGVLSVVPCGHGGQRRGGGGGGRGHRAFSDSGPPRCYGQVLISAMCLLK